MIMFCLFGVKAMADDLVQDPEYQALLNKANDMIRQVHESHSCPSGLYVFSCGNNICERNEEEYCPTDCSRALVKSYDEIVYCDDAIKVFAPSTTEEVQYIINEARNQILMI